MPACPLTPAALPPPLPFNLYLTMPYPVIICYLIGDVFDIVIETTGWDRMGTGWCIMDSFLPTCCRVHGRREGGGRGREEELTVPGRDGPVSDECDIWC